MVDLRRAHRRPPAKITEAVVATIRKLSAERVAQGAIALEVGVSSRSVARVQERERIPHMTRWEGHMAAVAAKKAARGWHAVAAARKAEDQ